MPPRLFRSAKTQSAIISAVLFGSSTTVGYSPDVSDVDVLIILRDGAMTEEKSRLRKTIAELEVQSGVT